MLNFVCKLFFIGLPGGADFSFKSISCEGAFFYFIGIPYLGIDFSLRDKEQAQRMTTARNFSRKFAEHPLELSPEIASRYFPMSSGLANFAQRKS